MTQGFGTSNVYKQNDCEQSLSNKTTQILNILAAI